MPFKTPAYAPPPVSWTGFYVGAGAGYGLWNADTGLVTTATGAPLTSTVTNGGRGWLGKLTAGYDYQFNSYLVAGVFGDYDFTDMKGWLQTTTGICPTCNIGGNEKESSSWAVGGRIGWLLRSIRLVILERRLHSGPFRCNKLGRSIRIYRPRHDTCKHLPRLVRGRWNRGSSELPSHPRLVFQHRVSLLQLQHGFFCHAVTGELGDSVTVHPYVQTVTSGLVYKFNWNGQ